ncbi:MAG: tetratricopeptide repeat protein [Candidatus Coatesbacteria bacterium]|nr:MAG: tetratricopeptide repeat protein [Candidatus Coatesbacteria bacterium]
MVIRTKPTFFYTLISAITLTSVTSFGADYKTELTDASKYFLLRDYDKAVEIIDGVLEEEPGNVTALELRGRIEIVTGDLDAALATFEEAVAADPEDYRGWQGKGDVLERMYKTDEALEAYSVAVENNKKASSSLYALAVLYAEKGEKENSFEYLKKAVKANEFLKETARNEPGFEGFRGDAEFWEIVN